MFFKYMESGPLGVNCCLLGDEAAGTGAVVDPGGSVDLLWREMAASGLKFDKILLTHGHFDHTGAVEELRRALGGAPVYLHAADAALLGADRLFPALGETVPYGEGDTVTVGGLAFSVLHTPGHTPGSVTLAGEGLLLTGDTLFAGSMGRTDFPGGSGRAMAASLRRLGELAGAWRVVPGHGEETTLDREREHNPYLREAMGR